MGSTRRIVLALMLALIVGLIGGCGGGGQAGGGRDSNSLTIGYIEWDEDVAVSNLAKVILEDDLGYNNVNLKLLEVGPVYQGVANGELDAFLDVWLPTTHKTYWDQYKGQVVDLGRWYEGTASLGLGVPDYVKAQSIEDLNDYRDEFGGQIIGIESGAGIMRIVDEQAIPGYGLDYDLVASSTPAMLSQLSQALENKQPIVFTAWKPHWMFLSYDIRYLDDPKGEMGGSEELSAIARKGLEEDSPKAFQLLDNIDLSEKQLEELELAISDAGDPEQGARDWIKDNRDVVEGWLPS